MSDRNGCLPELMAASVILFLSVGMALLVFLTPNSRVGAPIISAGNGMFGLRWDSTAAIERQRQETARKLAEEETNRIRAVEGAMTARIMWVSLAGFGVLAVGAWAWSRAAVARAQYQTPPPQLVVYMAHNYLPGDNIEAAFVDGQWSVVDHDKQEIVPWSVINR